LRKREPLYLRGIVEPAETLRELRSCLCIPTTTNSLCSADQVAARSVLGVECPKCFAQAQQSAAESERPAPAGMETGGRGHKSLDSHAGRLPVRLLLVEEPPVVPDTRGVKVTSFFSRGSGGGAACHTHKVSAPFPVFARACGGSSGLGRNLCVASAGVTRGVYRFEVCVSEHTQWASVGVVACHSEQAEPQSSHARSLGSGGVDAHTRTAPVASYFGLASDGLLHRSGADGKVLAKRGGGGGGASADRLTGCKYGVGDIVTCVVDLDAGLLVFLVNGKPCTPCKNSSSSSSVRVSSARSAGSRVAKRELLHILGLANEGVSEAPSSGGVGGQGRGGRRREEGDGRETTGGEDEELGEDEKRQLVELAGAALHIPDDLLCGTEIMPALMVSAGELLVSFSHSRHVPASASATHPTANSAANTSTNAHQSSLRRCLCGSPWCVSCGAERERVCGGERRRLQCLLQHWGRGRGRGEGGNVERGVAGLTELLLSQYSSATSGPGTSFQKCCLQ
jgi:hypothetical protein